MSALIKAGTFSKSPTAWGFEEELAVVRGMGPYLWLNDDQVYLDWVGGLGTNLLGYDRFPKNHNWAISPSLPHILEHEVADLLADKMKQHVPGWSTKDIRVRWCKTGTDATTMAVRLARALTGVNGVLMSGYHGWGDWSIASAYPAHGISSDLSEAVGTITFNQVESLNEESVLNDFVAAVIIEQPAFDPDPYYYPYIRKWCDDNGAIFIMDEVVTGLRYGLGGACELFNVTPDLICLGKSLGNGAPIAALVGPYDLMCRFVYDDPPFCSSTTWGETAGLVQAKHVLDNWDEDNVAHIWNIGELLIEGLRGAGYGVIGHPPRSVVQFEDKFDRAVFIHGMRKRGVLMNRPNFPSLSHTKEIVEYTIKAAKAVKEDTEVWKQVDTGKLSLPQVLFEER